MKGHPERSDRANKLISKLEETKENFAIQIIELVRSRNPFTNKDGNRNFGNLAAVNMLVTSPGMLADAKEGAKKSDGNL